MPIKQKINKSFKDKYTITFKVILLAMLIVAIFVATLMLKMLKNPLFFKEWV